MRYVYRIAYAEKKKFRDKGMPNSQPSSLTYLNLAVSTCDMSVRMHSRELTTAAVNDFAFH